MSAWNPFDLDARERRVAAILKRERSDEYPEEPDAFEWLCVDARRICDELDITSDPMAAIQIALIDTGAVEDCDDLDSLTAAILAEVLA